jgi:Fe-Mn family superoxide dismutase
MKTICLKLFIGLFLISLSAHAALKDLNELVSPFTLAPLPYAVDSLTKAIDAETMGIHHDKHHKAYVDNANKALEGRKSKLIDLLLTASQQSAAIRNNAGGHWNHSFFWSVLSGKETDNKIPQRLKKEIEEKWGTFEKFQEEFEKVATSQFGSGWAWLIRTPEGLEITSTPNQDNPLMDTATKRGWPLLGVDVWEHAYYLRYQNKRAEYLKNFWSIVNWKQVDAYNREAKKTKLPTAP